MKRTIKASFALASLVVLMSGCSHKATPTQTPAAVDTAFTYTCDYQRPIDFIVNHNTSATLIINLTLTGRQHHYHHVASGSDSGWVRMYLSNGRALDGGMAPFTKTVIDTSDVVLASQWVWNSDNGTCQLADSASHADSVLAIHYFRIAGDTARYSITKHYIAPPCTLHH